MERRELQSLMWGIPAPSQINKLLLVLTKGGVNQTSLTSSTLQIYDRSRRGALAHHLTSRNSLLASCDICSLLCAVQPCQQTPPRSVLIAFHCTSSPLPSNWYTPSYPLITHIRHLDKIDVDVVLERGYDSVERSYSFRHETVCSLCLGGEILPLDRCSRSLLGFLSVSLHLYSAAHLSINRGGPNTDPAIPRLI